MREGVTMMHSGLPENDIRQPVVAGSFYTADPKALSQEIDRYLKSVTLEETFPDLMGLISPHAGYMYSGQVAAYAYKQIEGRAFDAVGVLAPRHRTHFSGASVDTKQGYRPPLGVV